jgi:exosortase/archaeosortase family protein
MDIKKSENAIGSNKKHSDKFHTHPAFFVFIIGTIYAGWKVFFFFAHQPDTVIYPYWKEYVQWMGEKYAFVAGALLKSIEPGAQVKGIIIYTTPSSAVSIEEHCLAIPAMVIFSSAIIFFPGSWKQKLRFIPVGLLGIFIINIIRLFFLCEAWLRLTSVFYNIHHSYIYLVVTYGFIFLMIRWWMKNASAVSG